MREVYGCSEMRTLTRCLQVLATKSGFLYAAEALVYHPPCNPRHYCNGTIQATGRIDTFLRRRYSFSELFALTSFELLSYPRLKRMCTEQCQYSSLRHCCHGKL